MHHLNFELMAYLRMVYLQQPDEDEVLITKSKDLDQELYILEVYLRIMNYLKALKEEKEVGSSTLEVDL